MKRSRTSITLKVVTLVSAFLGSALLAAPAAAQVNLSPVERKLFEMVNQERARRNLPAYLLSPLLTQAAQQHSADMAREHKLEHGLYGKGPYQRMIAYGYKPIAGGENIAGVVSTPEEAMQSWEVSKGHWGNILSTEYTEIGIGAGASRDGFGYFWTQKFGRPEKAAEQKPAPGTVAGQEPPRAVAPARISPVGYVGTLTQNSPLILEGRRHAKYQLRLEAGVTYTLEMKGSFIPWLLVHDLGTGKVLANVANTTKTSRLEFTPTVSGDYGIIATTLDPGATGDFALMIQPRQ
jgi:uncharacterized protein YkwD